MVDLLPQRLVFVDDRAETPGGRLQFIFEGLQILLGQQHRLLLV